MTNAALKKEARLDSNELDADLRKVAQSLGSFVKKSC